jgi:hypothetical protein
MLKLELNAGRCLPSECLGSAHGARSSSLVLRVAIGPTECSVLEMGLQETHIASWGTGLIYLKLQYLRFQYVD